MPVPMRIWAELVAGEMTWNLWLTRSFFCSGDVCLGKDIRLVVEGNIHFQLHIGNRATFVLLFSFIYLPVT